MAVKIITWNVHHRSVIKRKIIVFVKNFLKAILNVKFLKKIFVCYFCVLSILYLLTISHHKQEACWYKGTKYQINSKFNFILFLINSIFKNKIQQKLTKLYIIMVFTLKSKL